MASEGIKLNDVRPISVGHTGTVGKLLENRIALITGSSKGIGKGCALLFAEHGAMVIVNGRNAAACDDTVEEIVEAGGRAISCPADITDSEQVQEMVDKIINQFGTIDILVNNAGTSRDGLIHKMSDEQFNFILDLNIKGVHNLTKAVLPYFTDYDRDHEFKKIINLTSITGITGNFGQSNYGMAKSGVIAYTKACARELSRHRINVNAVAPGFTETQMTQVKTEGNELGMPEAIRNLAIASTPFARDGHAGMPHHIASVILFYASSMSDWVTGQITTVDGGMYV